MAWNNVAQAMVRSPLKVTSIKSLQEEIYVKLLDVVSKGTRKISISLSGITPENFEAVTAEISLTLQELISQLQAIDSQVAQEAARKYMEAAAALDSIVGSAYPVGPRKIKLVKSLYKEIYDKIYMKIFQSDWRRSWS